MIIIMPNVGVRVNRNLGEDGKHFVGVLGSFKKLFFKTFDFLYFFSVILKEWSIQHPLP